jgi:hypothetical protein
VTFADSVARDAARNAGIERRIVASAADLPVGLIVAFASSRQWPLLADCVEELDVEADRDR